MKYLRILILTLAVAGSFAGTALAADFNNAFKDWSTYKSPGITPETNASTTNRPNNFCENMFGFQKDNNLSGTFCDIVSIGAMAVAGFATDVTCTIQKVSMGNYDNQIEFKSKFASGSSSTATGSTDALCEATNTGNGALKLSPNEKNIFGRGSLIANQSTNSVGRPDDSGIYKDTNKSQLSADIMPTQTGASSPSTTWVNTGFKTVRGIAMGLGLALLLVIAFANILHLDMNTYAVKRMIPNLIIALIGGYLSIYIIFFISRGIDFIYQFEIFSPYNAVHPFYNIIGGGHNFGLEKFFESSGYDQGSSALNIIFSVGNNVLGATGTFSLLSAIFGMVFLAVPALIVFAFEYVLALRPIAVGMLTVIAPVAFGCYVLPQTQNLFKKWWTFLLIALFYTPMVNFVFYLLNLSSPGASGSPQQGLIFILALLVKSAVVVMLVRLPFTIESDFKKLTFSLQKSTLAANLGLSKPVNAELKVKEQLKSGGVTDKILQTKAAQSLIAPVNKNINRNVTATKEETRSFARSFSQIINKTSPATSKEIETISAQAHKANLARPANLLVSATSDLQPQTFRKILNTSNLSLFRDTNIVNELKTKNGQVLDNQGALMRADAARKVTRLAQVVEQNRIANPDAVKALSSKGMLDVLPIEVLKLSLQQGVINKQDLGANFKDPEAAYSKIASYRRGLTLNQGQIQTEMEKDHQDASTGYTDLETIIKSNASTTSSPAAMQATSKTIENLRSQNQTFFDKNATYYIERLKQTNNNSKETIAKTLQVAGTPAKTAIAIAQNPNLPIDQIVRYLPPNSSPEIVNVIKESVEKRDIIQAATTQVAGAYKEDKTSLGKTVAEKVSQAFKEGNGRTFDDVKNQLSQSVKTLSSNPTPQDAKKAMSQISNFAPGTAITTAATATPEEMEKTKEKGEQVLGAIDEMKSAGIKEETVVNNPAQAAKEFEDHVSNQISQVLSNEVKDGKTVEGQIADLAVKSAQTGNASAESQTPIDQLPDEDESGMTIAQIDQDQKQAETALSSKTKDGKTFDDQLGEIASVNPNKV